MTVWARESLVQEIERRLWTISVANGCSIDIATVVRNPVDELEPYPSVGIYEFPDQVVDERVRGKTQAPMEYIREVEIDIEIWREVTNKGLASQQVTALHTDVRHILFGSDGGLLGGYPAIRLREVRTDGPIMVTRKNTLIGGMSIGYVLKYSDTV